MTFNEMNIVLTGATGGIGEALAHVLAQQGANLLLTGRNTNKLLALQHRLQSADCHVDIVAADLCTQEGLHQVVRAVENSAFQINVLINNAGVSHFHSFAQQPSGGIQASFEANIIAPMTLTQMLLPQLDKPQQALIVNIGSTFGSIGYPGYATYCSTKFAMRGFSEALSRELADSRIDVLYMAPRATKTPINSAATISLNTELGNKMDDPDTVAREIVTAIKDKKKQHFIGWPEKLFVKLNALFPALVTRSIVKKLVVIKKHFTTN